MEAKLNTSKQTKALCMECTKIDIETAFNSEEQFPRQIVLVNDFTHYGIQIDISGPKSD